MTYYHVIYDANVFLLYEKLITKKKIQEVDDFFLVNQ